MNSSEDARPSAAPSTKATWLKRAREWHLNLGLLFAPSILFFALSGTLQIFNLHEGRPGGSYQPPAIIVTMASIHKDATLEKHHGGPPPGSNSAQRPDKSDDDDAAKASGAEPQAAPDTGAPRGPGREARPGGREGGGEGEQHSMVLTYLLKWFFAFMALGLMTTTCLGIYMAFQYNRSRARVWTLLAAGVAIPGILLIAMSLNK